MKAINEIVQRFIDEYRNRLALTTIEYYEIAIRQFLSYSDKAFDKIKTRDIRNWMQYLESRAYKISSIKFKLSALRLFYQYCYEEKHVSSNPISLLNLPQREDQLPHYLEYDQLTQLRQHVEGNLKQRAVIEVLYATGIRLRELTAMKKDDILWSERMIRIPKGKGMKERMVLFTRTCAEHLKAYLQSRHDELPFVFLGLHNKGGISPRGIQYWFEEYRNTLEIYMTPHTLRHTFASHLAMKGMPLSGIQALLGHDRPHNVKVYTRLYRHAQKQMYDDWM
ncbi:tyrosine-type recombinase/integrase [Tenuibacillus multivorans]|uniref:Integrase/recombinase XerC/integrase/recombinase XerD n=1 Tax=Tenuibacillus multivorans TaxID=237069 RepID=A0A1G9X820_9BACI|nr:tyrosine-type recombinase/integrase [Tenuibacillus multivorans]GEL78674.1 integrase [Tenuibacillus multivorans]SDM92922.1 integrase/recombinase XerC/integrase/recombinase XerD [Tenuibacillus multivorans]